MKSGGWAAGVMLLLAGIVLTSPVLAGDLNPPGLPAPTMKTLDEIPQTWDKALPGTERFKLVIDGMNAVLDKETGLVWQRAIDQIQYTWTEAIYRCLRSFRAGRQGWRLPTIEELASLSLDTRNNNAPSTTLPSGHPFYGELPSYYWSATTSPDGTSAAMIVDFNNGSVNSYPKLSTSYFMCVRGGQGFDGH